MKIGVFSKNGSSRLCAVESDTVVDLEGAAGARVLAGETNAFHGLREFLSGGKHAVELAHQVVAARREEDTHPLAEVTLRAPYVPGAKILCHVINYQTHGPAGIPSQPFFFYKPSTSVIGAGDPISPHQQLSDELDWEAELAVVIGRNSRDVNATDAAAVIAGYTIVNDVSYRDLQFNRADPELSRRYGMNWVRGKGLDGSCPIGPWITLADELPNINSLAIRTYVNETLRQDGNTANMAYRVPEMVAAASRGTTLQPGDIISTGSPGGTGLDAGPYLKPGDVVRCEIDGLGALTNPVGNE